MLLSSVNRLYRYIGDDSGQLTASAINTRILTDWLTAVSARIEQWLDRSVQIAERVEYADATYQRTVYPVKAYPIVSVASVKEDSGGLFDGSESTLTDTTVDSNNAAVVLDAPLSYTAPRAVQMTYTGGMAYHPVNSVFSHTVLGGTFTAGNYVSGDLSGAMGLLKAVATASLTVENYYGVFEAGETLTQYSDEGLATATGTTGTLVAISRQSLSEAYPALVRAAELEVRYLWKHKHDFENDSTSPEGNSRRRGGEESYDLQPETKSMLGGLRRMLHP